MRNLARLFTYTKHYKKNIVLSIVAMSVQVGAGFALPYFMVDIIDDALPNNDSQLLIQTSLIMLGIALLGLLAGLVNNYNSQYVAQYASADMRLDLFQKIQSLSFNNIDKFKTSRLITSSTNDVVRIQAFYMLLLRIVVRAPLMIGFGLFMAFETSKQLSNIFYFSMPVLIIAIIVIMIIAFPLFQQVQKTVDGLNKVALENTNAPRVIKSFVSIEHENKKFEAANELFRVTNTKAEKVMAFIDPILIFIFNATIAGIVYLGVYYIQNGTLVETINGTLVPQVGIMLAFNSYSMQILFGLLMFAMMMIFLSRASVSAKRINEIFDEEVDIENLPNAETDFELQGAIEFKNVNFGYGKECNLVLKDISFTVHPGEQIGIIGSTGSGKSSLISLIPRLYDVCAGEILLDGKDIKQLDISTLRNQIGFVTQTATIFSGSIGTNIRQGNEEASYEEFVAASKNADAYEFIKDYDDIFNHEIQQKGTNLSGGQKQRLSLTRAFIRQPKILILDDATSAVDAKSEEGILQAIERLTSNMTSLVISQKISTIKDMDKILVLNNKGQVDGFDTHENLLKSSTVYQEIAQSQVGNGGDLDA